MKNVSSIKEEAINKATLIIKKLSQQVKLQDEEIEYYRQELQQQQAMIEGLQGRLATQEQLRGRKRSSKDLSTPTANARLQRTEASDSKYEVRGTPTRGKSYFVSNLSFKAVLNEVRLKHLPQRQRSVTLKDPFKELRVQPIEHYPVPQPHDFTTFADQSNFIKPDEGQLMHAEDVRSHAWAQEMLVTELRAKDETLQQMLTSSETSLNELRDELSSIISVVCLSLNSLTKFYRSIEWSELQREIDALQEPLSFSSTSSLIEYQRRIVEQLTPRVVKHFMRNPDEMNKLVYRLHHENQQLTKTLLATEQQLVESQSRHRIAEEELRERLAAFEMQASQLNSLKKLVDNIENPSDELSFIETVQSISVRRPHKLRRLGITNEPVVDQLQESCSLLFTLVLNQYDASSHPAITEIMRFMECEQYELNKPFTRLVSEVLDKTPLDQECYHQLLAIDQNVDFDKDTLRLFMLINQLGDHYLLRPHSRAYFAELMDLKYQVAHAIETSTQTNLKLYHRIAEAISIGSQFSAAKQKGSIGSLAAIKEDGQLIMSVLREGIRKAHRRYEERRHRSSAEESTLLLHYKIHDEAVSFRNALKLFDLINIRNLTQEAVGQTNAFILELIETALRLQTESDDIGRRIKTEPERRCELQTLINELLVELAGYKMAFNTLCNGD